MSIYTHTQKMKKKKTSWMLLRHRRYIASSSRLLRKWTWSERKSTRIALLSLGGAADRSFLIVSCGTWNKFDSGTALSVYIFLLCFQKLNFGPHALDLNCSTADSALILHRIKKFRKSTEKWTKLKAISVQCQTVW